MSQIPQGFVLGLVLGMGFFYYYLKERTRREIRKELLLRHLPRMLCAKFHRGVESFYFFSSEASAQGDTDGDYFLRLLAPLRQGSYGERLVLTADIFSTEDKSRPWETCRFYFRQRGKVWKAYRLDIGRGVLFSPRAALSDELKEIAEAFIYLLQFKIEGGGTSFQLGTLEGNELKEFEEWKQMRRTLETLVL